MKAICNILCLYIGARVPSHHSHMNIKGIFEEFKTFAFKGNVIDLAVGIVIGGAFGKLVEGVVNGLIMPLIGLQGWFAVKAGMLLMLSGVGQFLVLAAAVFFIFVKPINKLRALSEKPKDLNAPPSAPPATLEDVVSAIKELKKDRASGPVGSA
jgi:large conductance mechanosensitive channel